MAVNKGGIDMYTKGEWKVIDTDDTFVEVRAGTQSLGYFRKSDLLGTARLIASAPDLYEACLSALGVMATLDQNKGWVKEISGIIQKALAKADETL